MANVNTIFPDQTKYVKENLTESSLLEQAAEECVELAHALLKLSRIKRKENPTPTSNDDAVQNLFEEWSDLYLVMNMIGVDADYNLIQEKLNRWVNRIDGDLNE